LAAEIRGKYPAADVLLKPSSGGRFEVHRDGTPVFEKSKTHRHAKPGEILALLGTADIGHRT
jgi:predicted Rdx family selenoprotein